MFQLVNHGVYPLYKRSFANFANGRVGLHQHEHYRSINWLTILTITAVDDQIVNFPLL